MRKMGESSDIRAPVIDDLPFDPDVDASDIRVAEMNGDVVLTGVRRVRNDIQIRDREQP
jgi:osmotically-inducible protein OsmY